MELDFKKIAVRCQTNETTWVDEAGLTVPATRITKAEREREKRSFSLYKKASALSNQLSDFKHEMAEICDKVYDLALKEVQKNKLQHKGNFTWYNFNRSIKIEVNINERIDFDSILIKAAKDSLDNYLADQLSDKDELIRQLIDEAFSNTKGMLDNKRIFSLLKYRSKIKAKFFQEALDLIEKSIRRPDSRKYMRIFAKDANGDWRNIDLNFSSI